MTTLTHVQEDNAFEALTDEELESVDGGIAPIFFLPLILGPVIDITANQFSWSINSRLGTATDNSSDLRSEQLSDLIS